MFARYLSQLGVGLFVLAGLVAAINALVDASGTYRLDLLPLGEFTEAQGSRVTKVERLTWQRWDGVLFGSSRVAQGVSADDPLWNGQRVYNAGLPGLKYRQLSRLLNYSLDRQPPRRIWLFIDFFGFARLQREDPEFAHSRCSRQWNVVDFHVRELLGYAASRDSARSIANALRNAPADWSLRGDWIRDSLHQWARPEAFAFMLRMFSCSDDWFAGFEYDSGWVRQLGRDVTRARGLGIETFVVISPVHALQLELVARAGLWERFERWKADLLTELPGEQVIWDFTGCGAACEEAVTDDAGPDAMRWFYDNSHFTPALGRQVVRAVLQRGSSEGGEALGRMLSRDGLAEQLRGIREGRERYAHGHAREVGWVVGALEGCREAGR
jgi:hypothetical protein